MVIAVFIILAIILGGLTFHFSLKRKVKCQVCFSRDVEMTGQKRYKEDPRQIMGSLGYYNELEYKCNKCGEKFWEPINVLLFN